MAITTDDFNKIWASTSSLTPYGFSDDNYKQGWNFVGATPPSRQMWDYLQKQNDEKAQWLYLNVVQGIPIGVVQAFAGNTVPDGWLLCDGSAVSRTDYAELYAVIGDTYGAGDGVDTFNLPDLVDQFVQGSATSGTVKTAGLPNITGEFSTNTVRTSGAGVSPSAIVSVSGAFERTNSQTTKYYSPAGDTTSNIYPTVTIDASRSSSIYGNSSTVQPPAVTMRYIIKY